MSECPRVPDLQLKLAAVNPELGNTNAPPSPTWGSTTRTRSCGSTAGRRGHKLPPHLWIHNSDEELWIRNRPLGTQAHPDWWIGKNKCSEIPNTDDKFWIRNRLSEIQ